MYPVEHEATATAVAEGALLDEIVRRLTEALAPERIYLFGSRARGDAGPDSDYDLLVVVREYVGDRRAMSVEGFSALTGLGISKDVVLMSRHEFDWQRTAKASLPATIEREGRLLYAA